jgi:hypothetical protein
VTNGIGGFASGTVAGVLRRRYHALAYKPNNEEAHKRLIEELKSLMQQQTTCPEHGTTVTWGLFARNLFLGERIPLAGVAQQCGTIRFGNDPKTSALDRNCKARDPDRHAVLLIEKEQDSATYLFVFPRTTAGLRPAHTV